VSRRSLLLGGAAALVGGAGAGYAAEGPRVRRVLHLTRSSPHEVPDVPRGEMVFGSFRSTAMRAQTGWAVAYPHGSRSDAPLPLLLTLHGRTGDARDAFESTHYDRFLSAAVMSGVPPFAIASVDGGDHSYYHSRADGTDPQRMVLDELLPLQARRGLRTDRIGLHGVSMGGYGALLLAERFGPSRVAVVAADAPAIWKRWEDSSRGAFDGPRDFTENDVLAGSSALRQIPTRITVGSDDPFLPGVKAMLRRLPDAESEIGPGAHDGRWWGHTAPKQLAFVGEHLSRHVAGGAAG
jgi:S-formylglutathione hydrolase FrmB